MDVNDILDTRVPKDKTPNEHYKNLYEQIGQHFKENAEILASDLTLLTGCIEYKITLPVNELVSIEKTTNYLVEGNK
ncbi:hypothetical protein ACIQYS_09765 [Psychrobacillus sp. NPDC096426]|uniref:hypothetical protein n=1 Tax=Psychrobacillus sp. NPDC096426 TaxID=3364491 RepID=UPI00382133F0